MQIMDKVLILTIGYGQGHRSAAEGIAQELESRGLKVRIDDPCEADSTGLYKLTQAYYNLCVRKLPWLWSIAYSQTDTADWCSKVMCPGIRTATARVAELLLSWRPDIVVCTYPLFAYMVDFLRESGQTMAPCAVVVTDSIEISKPWVKSKTQLLFVPDEYSRDILMQRYGLSSDKIFVSGFPVRRQFLQVNQKTVPSTSGFRIVYGAYLSAGTVVQQLRCLLEMFPYAEITVLAGDKADSIRNRLSLFTESGKLEVLQSTDRMDALLCNAHLYIGKAGAATIFECYAAGVPVIVNYALPGQEQGNLQLLLRDEVGVWAEGTGEMCAAVLSLMRDGAYVWQQMRKKMLARTERAHGARSIVNALEVYLGER